MQHRRPKKYQDILFYYIKKISNDNKKKIRVNLLIDDSKPGKRWLDLQNELISGGIETIIELFPKVDNYMAKTRWAANQNVQYTAKLDEDIFISNYVWDYLIENLGVLEEPEVAALTVQLSNGIPSCEYIIEDFFDDKSREKIYELFKGKKFNSLWRRDYSALNIHTIQNPNTWNSEAFFDSVRNIQCKKIDWPVYYKGIHPIRVHQPCHQAMYDFILQNIGYFINKQKFDLRYIQPAYLCNSFFIVKTLDWKQNVIDKDELFLGNSPKDPWAKVFDEVALNQYVERNNLNIVFVKNSLCIHTMYKILKQSSKEEEFVDKFRKLTIG